MNTVSGVIDASELGVTLMHEHVVVRSNVMRLNWPEALDHHAIVASAARRLEDAASSGVQTVVDMTTGDLGRDAELLAAVAAAVPVHVVATTGLWKYPPPQFEVLDVAAAAALFVRDAEVGIQGSGVRAGVIKMTSQGTDLTPAELALLRACARAHAETGLPIFTHTDPAARGGLAQQEAMVRQGVEPHRIVIGHCSTTDLDYVRRLVDGGSVVSVDKFGFGPPFPSTDEQVELVARLCALGHERQVVLSHDTAGFAGDWTTEAAGSRPDSRFSFLPDVVLPALRRTGVPEAAIRAMMIETPRSVLEAAR